MARVLVSLKLRLLRRGLQVAGARGVLGAVFAVLLAVALGSLGGVAFLGTRLLAPAAATDVTAAAFAVLLFVWMLGPVVGGGAEGTLEPDRLALFPLTSRQLMPGLLAAALVGFGGLTTVLVLLGAVGGMAPLSLLAGVTVAAAAVQLLLCAAASRLVTSAISGAVRSRRWRDVALFVGPVTALVLNVGAQVLLRSVSESGQSIDDTPAVAFTRVAVRMLPSGPGALAMGYAREGRVAASLLALAGAVLVTVAVVAVWAAVQRRLVTTAGGSPLPRRRRVTSLFPRWASFLPRTRAGAVAAKELRLTWRDPRQRGAVLGAVFAAIVPAFSFRVLASTNPRVVLVAALPAYVFAAGAANLYGYDGPAHWTNVAAGDDPAADLLGKGVARALVAACLVAVALVVFGVRSGSSHFVAPAIGLAAAGFGVNLGLSNVTSVVAPQPMPDNPANVFSAGDPGQGLAAVAPSLVVLFVGVILLTPILIPLLLVDGTAALAGTALAGLAYGLAVWWAGWRIAVRRSAGRQPELLAALSA